MGSCWGEVVGRAMITDMSSRSLRRSVQDIVCVIRTVGERTTGACSAALRTQLGQEPISISHTVFRETVRECFDVALNSAKPLLLTVDADVLPYSGAVDELLRVDSEVPDSYLQVVASVDDHVFGVPRVGGLRLYRADHLTVARRLLESSDLLRPESGLVKHMAAEGSPSAYSSSVIGLHDSNQYNVDLFRKGVFFAHKHDSSLPELARRLRCGVDTEPDFRALLRGLAAGILEVDPSPDAAAFSVSRAREDLGSAGIVERSPLSEDEIADLLGDLPPARRVDPWRTYPMPGGMVERAREKRRVGESVSADIAQRVLRRASKQLEKHANV